MIALRDITKAYRTGGHPVVALRDISLEIPAGQFVAITGPSGSGKSTLMNVIGLLESFDGGQYFLSNIDIGSLSEDQIAFVRNRRLGFVFQSYNLIPRLNALRNVELPLIYAGVPHAQRRARAAAALHGVGLGDRMNHTPTQLSGGQQQRVAIARAIINDPDIIIADEPTGALDSASARDIMEIFRYLNANGKTIVMVTHDDEVASYARRVIHMRDGEIRLDREL